MIAAAALGLGAGGAALTDNMPVIGPGGPSSAETGQSAPVETIRADSPDIVWVTVQKPSPQLAADFNAAQLQAQKDSLNFNLQSAAGLGNVDTVQDLLNKGADAAADDSAALKMALSGAKSATNAHDREHFDAIARMLKERGATASDQQSMADRTSFLNGKTAPGQFGTPPSSPGK